MVGRREMPLADAEHRLQPLSLPLHERSVNGACFAPRGSMLAAASSDGTLSLWDVQSGTCLHHLRGHAHDVLGCDFSPDGCHLASVSDDGCIKVWQVADGSLLTSLQVDGELVQCAWTGGACGLAAVGAMGVYFLECRGLPPAR